MAVTLGNTSSGSINDVALVISHTTSAGTDKEIRVGIATETSESISTVVWDAAGTPINGTLVRSEVNAGSVLVEIWEIPDPPASSTKNITITPVTKARMVAGIADFNGADPSGTTNDSGASADAATSASTTAPGVTADDFVFDMLAMDASQTATVGANQTAIINEAFSAQLSGACSHQDGADGGVMSWTFASTNYAIAACRVPAVAAGGLSIPIAAYHHIHHNTS